MQTFNYKALTKAGKDKIGVIQAETAKQARQLLRAQGLMVTNIESEKDRGLHSKKSRSSESRVCHSDRNG